MDWLAHGPMVIRCGWPADDVLMVRYHDQEWGVPLHDDRKLFEFLVLDAFQAGLSWRTILHRRKGFEAAFAGFDPKKVAAFDARRVARLMKDERIIRNRLKIEGTIKNAKAFLAIQQEFGSFDAYIWGLAGGKPRINRWRSLSQLPAKTSVSDAMSQSLRARGMTFVGSTICYAFMQAAGMVNDHTTDCFRWKAVQESGQTMGRSPR
jgi:DNA-3-methyladenine glycosylase I